MDLISRKAAIEALQKEINKGIPPFDDVFGAIRCGVRLARNIVEDLPAAQSDLSGYSDRLWRNAYERGKRDAQSEIIRCKDCRYWDTSPKNTVQPNYHECRYGIIDHWTTTAEDYCSRGERLE